MKKMYLIFGLFLINLSIRAQTKSEEPILLNVTYQFVYINNLADKENPIKKDMVLSFGKNKSRYISSNAYNRLNIPKPSRFNGGGRVVSGIPIVLVDNNNSGIIDESYLMHPTIQNLQTFATIGNTNYTIEQKLIRINWKIEKETKEIGGFICQKAIGIFSGRTYVAWFAPDLPFQCGPFKLWGLPGLILEAEDSAREVRFLFKDINKETDSTKLVTIAGNSPVKISLADYNTAKKAYQKNPDTYMQSQLPADAPKVTKVGDNGVDIIKKFKYNPIEMKP